MTGNWIFICHSFAPYGIDMAMVFISDLDGVRVRILFRLSFIICCQSKGIAMYENFFNYSNSNIAIFFPEWSIQDFNLFYLQLFTSIFVNFKF